MGRKSLLNASIDTAVLDAAQVVIGKGKVSQWIEERMSLLTQGDIPKKKMTPEQKIMSLENTISHLSKQLREAQAKIQELNKALDVGKTKYERLAGLRNRRI